MHTPTPWTLEHQSSDDGNENFGGGVLDSNGKSYVAELVPEKDDAEFIVKAVNNHDALVAALEAAIIEITNYHLHLVDSSEYLYSEKEDEHRIKMSAKAINAGEAALKSAQ